VDFSPAALSRTRTRARIAVIDDVGRPSVTALDHEPFGPLADGTAVRHEVGTTRRFSLRAKQLSSTLCIPACGSHFRRERVKQEIFRGGLVPRSLRTGHLLSAGTILRPASVVPRQCILQSAYLPRGPSAGLDDLHGPGISPSRFWNSSGTDRPRKTSNFSPDTGDTSQSALHGRKWRP